MATQPITFIFLHDPQLETDNGADREARLNVLNSYLNKIDTVNWPNDGRVAEELQGKPIGKPAFLIIGGDITENGGFYNGYDQLNNNPSSYNGGMPLATMRYIYDKKYKGVSYAGSTPTPPSENLVRSVWDKTYFGLGNHDLYSDNIPGVWWLGYNGIASPEGSREDYWRYQMWNFICQMHTGTRYKPEADLTLTGPHVIDDGLSVSFDWK